jgi:hypothetical protein
MLDCNVADRYFSLSVMGQADVPPVSVIKEHNRASASRVADPTDVVFEVEESGAVRVEGCV